MSVNKLAILLFSSFLIFATAPVAPAQSTQDQNQEQTKKQTKKGTAKKETGQNTEQNAPAAKEKKAGTTDKTETGKTGAKKAKKTSSLSMDKVRQVQTALKMEGFDPGPIDGMMGPMTMTALRNYQSHNQLEVTGTLTAETENALLHGATATTRQGALAPRSSIDRQNQQQPYSQSEQQPYSQNQQQPYNRQQAEQSLNETQPSTPESRGLNSEPAASSVEDVKQIQQSLADLQFNPGEINGIMTAETQQAIRQFQLMNNLPVTGIVDEQTKTALDQARAGVQAGKLEQTPLSTEREKPALGSEEQQNRTDAYNQNRTDTSNQNRSDTYNQNRADTTQDPTDTYNATQNRDTTADHDRSKKDHSTKSHDRTAGKWDKDAADRINKAAAVLQDLTASSDKRIPNELLERAEAIAVIPHMIKGAFGIGGRYGKGVVAQRMDSGRWSPPAFIEIGGGSFGLQIGATATDLVLVFTDRNALDLLESGKDLKLGVDAGVVAGPIGREAEAGVNANLKTAVYAYSRAKGLFAGVALDGAVLNMDNDTNHKVYGESVDAKQIMNGNVAMNSLVRPFMDALEKVVPKKRISQK
jgi:lipid-binding SYLF domain-containing protein/peptidoglycan hydrolase-like protein with peptidoglycan-binding domain